MKRFLFVGLGSLPLLFVFTISHANDDIDAKMQLINQQTKRLEKEIVDLRQEVKRLKKQKRLAKKSESTENKTAHLPSPGENPYFKVPKYHQRILRRPAPPESAQPFYTRFHHPVTVTTSPPWGIKTAFDASDLLQQYSTMNEDLMLLRNRQKLQQELLQEGQTLNNRAVIVLSGGIEGQAMYASGYGGAQSSVNLTTAEIDVNGIASAWANAFMSLEFDDSPAITGSRVPNSRIYLRRGFLTIGNLDVSPVYFTVGQMYVPFGNYAAFPLLTTPMTTSLMRVRVRALVVGVVAGPFYGEVYGYTGNMTTARNAFLFKQGGGNVGVAATRDWGGYDAGVGVITNIADAEGEQNNGLPESVPAMFRGFGEPSVQGQPTFNNLRHRVSGFDVHTEITIYRFKFLGEYIVGLQTFDPMDLTFNNFPARPSVMHVQVNYVAPFRDRGIHFGLAYDRTFESLAFNLPQSSISFAVQTSFWKNTVEGIEYQYSMDYPVGTMATGGTPMPGADELLVLSAPFQGTGSSRNMVIGQVGVYF